MKLGLTYGNPYKFLVSLGVYLVLGSFLWLGATSYFVADLYEDYENTAYRLSDTGLDLEDSVRKHIEKMQANRINKINVLSGWGMGMYYIFLIVGGLFFMVGWFGWSHQEIALKGRKNE